MHLKLLFNYYTVSKTSKMGVLMHFDFLSALSGTNFFLHNRRKIQVFFLLVVKYTGNYTL